MTRQELDEIRQLVENATPPPWEVHYYGKHKKLHNSMIAAEITRQPLKIATVWNKTCICVGRRQYNNQDFIANARTFVPKLLAYIDELEARCGKD